MSERSIILKHAVTVLAGQLAIMAFGVTDTVVAGRYSEEALAALSIGSAVFISVYVSLMGVLQALLPIWAEQRGAEKSAQLGASVRQSLYICVAATVIGMSILLSPDAILRWTDVPEAMRGEVRGYLNILAFALPASLLFRIYSTLNQSLGFPQLVTWLQVASLALKIPLSIWFTFGGAGLAAQGAAGCAWATLVVNYSLMFCGIYMLRTQRMYDPLALWKRMEAPNLAQLARFLRLGVPAGLSILVEVTSFTLMALFIARQGVIASAAHQILANVAAVLYMVPLSLSISTSSRVSFWRGASNESNASTVAKMGYKMTLAMGLLLSLTLLLGKGQIAAMYSTNAQVVALTSALLVWVAAYHLSDAIQVFCIFVLRSYRVTFLPFVVYALMLWGGGLWGGYLLAYQGISGFGPTLSPVPFWACSAVALLLTAVIFSALLARSLKRSRSGSSALQVQH